MKSDAQLLHVLSKSATNKRLNMKYPNGTQAQLDAAKDDAMLIPEKTMFSYRNRGVHRIDHEMNDSGSVFFLYPESDDADFHFAEDLEPIHE